MQHIATHSILEIVRSDKQNSQLREAVINRCLYYGAPGAKKSSRVHQEWIKGTERKHQTFEKEP
jgi:hypothetical protein